GPERRQSRLAVVGLGDGVLEGTEKGTNSLHVAGLVFDQKNFLGHELGLLSLETLKIQSFQRRAVTPALSGFRQTSNRSNFFVADRPRSHFGAESGKLIASRPCRVIASGQPSSTRRARPTPSAGACSRS